MISNSKPYLFLDFDLTCTYSDGLKYYLNEFLQFCVNNFKVYWCSYATQQHIMFELNGNVNEEYLTKIIYSEVKSNSKLEYIFSIIEDSDYFVYVDDDISVHDLLTLNNINLSNNYIKAFNYKYDLYSIMLKLNRYLKNNIKENLKWLKVCYIQVILKVQ